MTTDTATTATEIAEAIHRISTYQPDGPPGGITFNQFVVMGDEPLLLHTGTRRLFPAVRDAAATRRTGGHIGEAEEATGPAVGRHR